MIVVDIMGGDFAPQATIRGALSAAKKGTPVLLSGPEAEMRDWLCAVDSNWKSYPIKLFNAKEVIEMDEDPVKSVLKKTDSSLVLAVKSVKAGEARAVVSAGNSGALLAASTFILGREEGVERPAIAGFLPGKKRSVLCLDIGANTECKPEYLLTFAHMGVKHLIKLFGVVNPRVGLLSNGTEDSKGSKIVKETHELLKQSTLNFVGNVEPSCITNNKVDVVVTDGFSGNVLLKSMESTALMVLDMMERGSIAEEFVRRTNWEAVGGALLLGVKGTVIVSHGCSNATAIENAIKSAWLASNEEAYLPSMKSQESNFNSIEERY